MPLLTGTLAPGGLRKKGDIPVGLNAGVGGCLSTAPSDRSAPGQDGARAPLGPSGSVPAMAWCRTWAVPRSTGQDQAPAEPGGGLGVEGSPGLRGAAGLQKGAASRSSAQRGPGTELRYPAPAPQLPDRPERGSPAPSSASRHPGLGLGLPLREPGGRGAGGLQPSIPRPAPAAAPAPPAPGLRAGLTHVEDALLGLLGRLGHPLLGLLGGGHHPLLGLGQALHEHVHGGAGSAGHARGQDGFRPRRGCGAASGPRSSPPPGPPRAPRAGAAREDSAPLRRGAGAGAGAVPPAPRCP